MTLPLPEYLLDLPAEAATRLIALSLLEPLRAARARLEAPSDPEALHDFRVALRRLRSCLRAYRPQLRGEITRKTRRRLRSMARASRDSRDLEVHLGWLREQLPDLNPSEQAGVRWLAERLEENKLGADAKFRRVLTRRFDPGVSGLDRQLREYRARIELATEPRSHAAAAVIGGSIERLAGDLETALAGLHSVGQVELAHRARIAAKRLRYLLEPIAGHVADAAALVERLKLLQDRLGDLHDSHVFVEEIARALEIAGREHSGRLSRAIQAWDQAMNPPEQPDEDPRPGLLALAQRLRERGAQAFENVRSEWLDGAAGGFFDSARELARTVTAWRPRSGVEVERKYLLREVPPEARAAESLVIEQGYLPGTRVVERLRQVRVNGGSAWYRTIKAGSGLARLELEEETTRELFESVWPLTAGHRIIKRRHRVPEGELTWEIDEFLDRDLVIAEIELPDPETSVRIPSWMEPYLIREVTTEAEFSNYQLAK